MPVNDFYSLHQVYLVSFPFPSICRPPLTISLPPPPPPSPFSFLSLPYADSYTTLQCKHIAPKFDALAAKYASSCVFLRVDVDQNQETARAAGVSSMPTFHFIHNHSTIESFSGADATKLEETIERLSKQYSRSFLSGPGAGRAGGDEDVPSGGPRRNPWADRNFVPPGMRSLEEAKVQSSAAQNQQQQQRTAPNVPERTNLTSTVPVVKPTPAPAPPIAGNNDESAAGKEESTDPAIVSLTNQLLEMGFDKSRIQAAIVVGKTTDVVAALEWLSDSKNDNVVAPPPESKSSSHSASPSSSAAASAGPGKGLGKTSLSQEEREDLELLRSTLDLKTMKPKTPSEQNTEAARQSAGPAEARPTRSAQEEALARRRAEYWAKRDNEDVIKAKEQYEQNKRMQEAQEALQAQKAKFDAEQGELRVSTTRMVDVVNYAARVWLIPIW